MAKSPRLFRITAIFLLLGLSSACTSQTDAEPPRAPTSTGALQPYHSPPPSKTPSPLPPAATETPLPSPTPHLYTIAKGDTMGGIALRFGISTEDLIAANPSIPPSAMSVGKELLIPDGETPLAAPTLEPLPLELSEPSCYPVSSGGTWCFLSVYNGTGEIAESVSATIRIHDNTGKLLAEETAFLLLDQLPPETRGVLLAFFPSLAAEKTAYALLQTALPAPAEDTRYLPASLHNVLTEISWDGMAADVQGTVSVAGDFSRLWVVATALDDRGKVVGARRWESAAGETEFHLTVSSLGHEVETVLLSVEAKP